MMTAWDENTLGITDQRTKSRVTCDLWRDDTHVASL